MSDFSNRTILLLILMSIGISAFGILNSERGTFYITGFAGSGTSSASVNITEEVSVKITDGVDFYSGRVFPNASYAILDSNLGKYTTQYSQLSSTNPNSRTNFKMAYDSKRDKIVLFGGASGVTLFGDTWEFDSSNWTNITTQNAPSKRYSSGMVYDNKRNVTVLFGGRNLTNYYNDTWEYNGTNWNQINTANAPHKRDVFDMVYDSKRNVTVLFGGHHDEGNISRFNDTWEYNGTDWRNMTPAVSPPSLQSLSMIYDSLRNVVVLYGGEPGGPIGSNDTWEYDGMNWTNRTIPGQVPGRRVNHIMIFDSSRNITVLVGGLIYGGTISNSNKTWEYNGNRWYDLIDSPDSLATSNLSSDFSGAGVFDTLRKKIVIFAGFSGGNTNITVTYNASETEGGIVNGTWFFYRQYFLVENDGTVNISVNFTGDKNATTFLGGTSPQFQVKGIVKEAGACPDLITTYTEVQAATQNICPILKFGQSADTFGVPIRLQIPNDAGAGLKNATVTLSASKA